ncbi:hypothetical protein HPB52_024012 [Rhipicephalus sanguineus]|uniref:Uncharacterized protein n=1 Tax=Rhipicephalus sanguineus TaxID=34632 RepID=A0A9D4PTE9_RHISA|nr:hypothetical protein HPB52_024012 [Rhipicephalus sanguineus]
MTVADASACHSEQCVVSNSVLQEEEAAAERYLTGELESAQNRMCADIATALWNYDAEPSQLTARRLYKGAWKDGDDGCHLTFSAAFQATPAADAARVSPPPPKLLATLQAADMEYQVEGESITPTELEDDSRWICAVKAHRAAAAQQPITSTPPA